MYLRRLAITVVLFAVWAVAAVAQTYDLTERYRPGQVVLYTAAMTLRIEATVADPELQKELAGGFRHYGESEARYRILQATDGKPTEVRVHVIKASERTELPDARAEETVSDYTGATLVIKYDDKGEPLYETTEGEKLTKEQVSPFSADVPSDILQGLDVTAAKVGEEWVQEETGLGTNHPPFRLRFLEVATENERRCAKLELTLAEGSAEVGDGLTLENLKGIYLFDLDRHLSYTVEAEGDIAGEIEIGDGAKAPVSGKLTVTLKLEEVAAE